VTLLLAHPEAEDLGRFVEGTLDDPQRTAIVDHIADCDDCRIVVVDAAEFIEPAKKESRKWWMGIAASLMLIAAIGGLTYRQFHDQEADVKKEYAKLPNRPLDARLSGFPYVSRTTYRGVEDEKDLQLIIMQDKAGELTELHGNDPKTLHARGVGLLLSEKGANDSIAPLQAAATAEPNNARYQSDLAVALIAAASGDKPMLQRALAACDRALQIDRRSPDALFNRAVALEVLGRDNDARAAYQRYLAVDSKSPWAAEARRHFDDLQPIR
jgi:tetratricopeptide (TPR) repeat protein